MTAPLSAPAPFADDGWQSLPPAARRVAGITGALTGLVVGTLVAVPVAVAVDAGLALKLTLGAALWLALPVLALVFVPSFTRVAHASVMTVRAMDYVDAVKLMGAPSRRIIFRTILPNVSGPLFVQFSFVVAMSVVLESGLSYLGLGVLPPEPSLGMMIGAARATFLTEPWLLLAPCILLSVLILVLNAFCDHLRHLLDPRRSAGS